MLDITRDEVADDTATRSFAELVCADPAWVDAEFDAIMTANFGADPLYPSRRPVGPRPGSAGPRRPHPLWYPDDRFIGVVRDEGSNGRRQRSPPLPGTPT
jgi:hypothetical protein